jgi:predicted lipid-binding transport protein (Tim44 family)
MQNFDVLTLVFLGLAVFVIFKLRSVLGTRTGTERKPEDMMRREDANPYQQGQMPNNVVPMPGMRQPNTPAIAEPEARLAALMPKDHPAFPGLVQIMAADPEFDPQDFVQGARGAYEMIVMAFAQGDKRTLKDLLAKDVFEGFEAAINDREKRKEKVETQFVSIDKAEIIDSMLRVRHAQVTVKFMSKLITATRDAAGTVIDGSAEKVADVTDIWTFQRDVSTNDPNWRLIATESAQ